MKKGTLKFVLVAWLACVACDKEKTAPTPAPSAAPSTSATVSAASSSAPAAAASADTGPACDPEKTGDCEMTCLGGRASACGLADALLRRGPDDPAKRLKLNEKGCELGEGKSCSRLGAQHANGDGTPKDAAKAAAAYDRGCEKGWGNACWLAGSALGQCGTGRQDLAKARAHYAKGCALGHADSCKDQQVIDKGEACVDATLEDIIASPSKWEGKHVYLRGVAVRRASPTSGVTLKPGGSPALDGVPSIVASDQDETRKKWLKLPTPVRGVAVTFVEAMVEKQMARDERARLVVMDIGDVVP